MTLKKVYDKQEDAPEGVRDHYTLKDGKYHLSVEGIDSLSGLVEKRDELLGKVTGHAAEIRTKDARIAKLEGDLETAKGTSLPTGHVAVRAEDAQLLETYRPLGKPEDLKRMQREHGTLKSESETRTTQDHRRAVARALDWNEEAFLLLPNLPEIEVRDVTENGKTSKQVIAKVKAADGAVTEKPFVQHFEATPELKVFESSLKKQQGGTPWPRQTPGSTGAPPTNLYGQIREEAVAEQKQQSAPTDWRKRVGAPVAAG